MRLEKIKLAGFKSFVDPTSIDLASDLIGIVGPNGCGKSNIVDAIRWVLGENSVKQLRGTSSTDVIFNGSKNRQPIGRASIELLFDNSDAKIGGEYVRYNQISIGREIDRSGQSTYLINGATCRRKDIIDAFLGTGIGSYNYAIIEQGLINQFIEAKPEELRECIEEAAGISKYKERRRETETRIEHTRENLNRVKDVIHELDIQLQRLNRQSKAAERYQILKEEERQSKAQGMGLRWLNLEKSYSTLNSIIQSEQTTLEAQNAELQSISKKIEENRTRQLNAQNQLQSIQNSYYISGNEVARLDQAVEHYTSYNQQTQIELDKTERFIQTTQQIFDKDQMMVKELIQKNDQLLPQLIQLEQEYKKIEKQAQETEQQLNQWLLIGEQHQLHTSDCNQRLQIQETHIHHLKNQCEQLHLRIATLSQERNQLNSQTLQNSQAQSSQILQETKKSLDTYTHQLSDLDQQLQNQHKKNNELENGLKETRQNLHPLREQFISLQVLQQSAFGTENEEIKTWLKQNALDQNPRLAENITVEEGWEKATEIVLKYYLEGLCVENSKSYLPAISSLKKGNIVLIDIAEEEITEAAGHMQYLPRGDSPRDAPTKMISNLPLPLLISKIKSSYPIFNLLESVYITETLDEALIYRPQLKSHESIVTKNGIWLGKTWVYFLSTLTSENGIIAREKELRNLKPKIEQLTSLLSEQEALLQKGKQQCLEIEKIRSDIQQQFTQTQTKYQTILGQHQALEAQLLHITQRQDQINQELKKANEQYQHDQDELQQAQHNLFSAQAEITQYQQNQKEWLEKKQTYDSNLQKIRELAKRSQEKIHHDQLEYQTAKTQIETLQISLKRTEQQLNQLSQQKQSIKQTLSESTASMTLLQPQLQEALTKRSSLEKELDSAKQNLQIDETDLQNNLTQQNQISKSIQTLQQTLEEKRLQAQELKTRQITLQEQLSENQLDLESILQQMPETLTEEDCQKTIEKIGSSITHLGAINLAAVEEYKELIQRKEYLDKQNQDLEEALQTLQEAIQKIDNESLTRFQETFVKLNQFFKTLFPKIFGGGTAYLDLLDDQSLSPGLVVMAQPPGKHLRNIHLLSGGEKALTAIALIFSLFELNPAPFCILDEVDAPLDDANISRFCHLLKEMSTKVQLLIISHNKNTIEVANNLLGVTMHEPGVSRIVAVNIDQALSMAEQK